MDRSHDPQIDDRERLQPETAEIVVDRAFKLRRRHRRVPRGVGPAFRANFRHDDKTVRIGVQGLADQLVRDIGAIIVAGVDMIDAARDRLAQDLDRPVAVLRRPEHPRTRELHSAVAHALHNPVAERKRSGSVDHGLLLDRPRIPPRRRGRYRGGIGAAGSVGTSYLAAGTFSAAVNFGTRTGAITINGLDGTNYAGTADLGLLDRHVQWYAARQRRGAERGSRRLVLSGRGDQFDPALR